MDSTAPHSPTPGCPSPTGCSGARGYTSNKARYLARLRRIEGQTRGVARMLEADQRRVDILTQVSALTAALRSLGLGLIDDHMKHCVLDTARLNSCTTEERIRETSQTVARFSCL